jgi:hypothetical protein
MRARAQDAIAVDWLSQQQHIGSHSHPAGAGAMSQYDIARGGSSNVRLQPCAAYD